MQTHGTGWRRDLPDIRDFHVGHNAPTTGQALGVRELLAKASLTPGLTGPATEGPDVDLRDNMPPVFDQGTLSSCVFNSVVAQVEYMEQLAYRHHSNHSRLWGYKAGRDILHWQGDTGLYTRTAFKVLRLLGLPEEDDWPYDVSKFDLVPPWYTLGIAENFKTLSYFRLDTGDTPPDVLLAMARNFISRKIPISFGFSMYENFGNTWPSGIMPLPAGNLTGGHEVLASGDFPSRKAILCRNSWGENWGMMGGYFYMPYAFILAGQTADWWVCLSTEWVDTGAFN